MLRRLVVLSLCLLAGAVLVGWRSVTENVAIRRSFDAFPMTIGSWTGRVAPDFDDRVLTVLGVDDYVNRVYLDATQYPLGLYIGYYESQRQGDTIHSPLNCLPGAGWQPMKQARMSLRVRDGNSPRDIEVNRVLIQKGLDKQLVLYWYQSHGRVVASEYWGKVYLVVDAIRFNRSDGAMVRVVAPIGDSETEAERRAVQFVETMFPLLGTYLPG
jgi:EpsI family protein